MYIQQGVTYILLENAATFGRVIHGYKEPPIYSSNGLYVVSISKVTSGLEQTLG